jgi:uncharacterized protein (DUF1015 family)
MVSAPPYDTVSEDEARAEISRNQSSYLRITRPEADMPPPADPHSAAAYAKALENFRLFQEQGLLVREGIACLYVYRLVMGGRAQTGVAACCAASDYMDGVIVRHEKTRLDKEEDRVKLARALGAHTGPVFLAYRQDGRIDAMVEAVCRGGPDVDFTAPDGVRHTLWMVPSGGGCAEAFRRVPRAYIADGHHRAAAAVRVAAESGAGLGLSIVDTLARRMGAKLVLSSPPEGRRNGFEARLVWQTSSR